MKVGSGAYEYEVHGEWVKLPEGVRFGYTHGIVTDTQDRVYIFNTSKDAVIVLSEDGQFLGSWGERFKSGAHGMLLNREGEQEFLYLVDTALHQVVKTTLTGEELLVLEDPGLNGVYNDEHPYVPTDVAVAPNGDIYVSDGYGQSWVHRYRSDGTYMHSWGGRGSEPGRMDCPHGISVDTRGSEPVLYVADRSNDRIQVFTLEGEHIRFVSGELKKPCSFYQFGDDVYIPDLFSRVTILNANDEVIVHLGESENYKKEGWPNLPKSEFVTGRFSSPHGVCVDSKGNLYVAEWVEDGRVTKLVRSSCYN